MRHCLHPLLGRRPTAPPSPPMQASRRRISRLSCSLARSGRPVDSIRSELKAALALPDLSAGLKARAQRALARLDLAGDPAHSLPPNSAAASADLLAALELTPEQPEDILLSADRRGGARPSRRRSRLSPLSCVARQRKRPHGTVDLVEQPRRVQRRRGGRRSAAGACPCRPTCQPCLHRAAGPGMA